MSSNLDENDIATSASPTGLTEALSPSATGLGQQRAEPDRWMSELGNLLTQLQDPSAASVAFPPVISSQLDNQLVQVRLGIAAGLFASLRCRHGATAGHALRVALTTSAWAHQMGIPPAQRDVIELAALLHDVGDIGVPDHVLLKPSALDADEMQIMARSMPMSLEILQACCASREVLEIVATVPAWYNGARPGYPLAGEQIPLGARMIAIAEAFDAMTTDHVYRSAMSLELAMTELFECAGSQFCPRLVRRFAEFQLCDQTALREETAARWLGTLDPQEVYRYWHLAPAAAPPTERRIDTLFQDKLLENMYDAVIFADAALRVLLWNRGAERLTGISGAGMEGRRWEPELLQFRDERGSRLGAEECPLQSAIHSGVQSLRRLTICGRNGRSVPVDAHCVPVAAEDGATLGAILLMHDASSEISLEERCQTLREKAIRDPMTQVANRAEFDRVHARFVETHQDAQVACSLIICDLDRFKQVNDTYGHQAGDDAIKTLAAILKNACGPGDLVARYGGEEFVMLCADCDNATAAQRAEEVRVQLARTPQPKLDGRCVTASFGVTEIQPGDTPETMLRRADRALLMAKSKGRNQVVQLGSGSPAERAEEGAAGGPAAAELVVEQVLTTPVPMKMVIEKLRGFVADHQAKIVAVAGGSVTLEIDDVGGPLRRRTDRPVSFRLELQFEEEQIGASDAIPRTRIRVLVRPKRNRDRRRSDAATRAREVLVSLRSYLIASIVTEQSEAAPPRQRRRFLIPWLWR